MSRYQNMMEEISQRMLALFSTPLPSQGGQIDDIVELESELVCTLPQDYRDFVANYGGSFIPAAFPYLNENSAQGAVENFLGVNRFHSFDLFWHYRRLKESSLGKFLRVAIGDNGSLLMSLREGAFGHLYFISSNEEPIFDQFGERNLVAKSFDDFMHKVKVLERDRQR